MAARPLGRWTRYELGTMGLALFLVLTPGFGVQYLVYVVPLLFASTPEATAARDAFRCIFGACNGVAVRIR